METWEQYWNDGVDFCTYLSESGQKYVERWMLMHKLYQLTEGQKQVLATFQRPMNILTVSGIWCGDCVAQVPLIERIAEGSRLLHHRLLSIESLDEGFLSRWQINGGRRVPMVFLLSQDFQLGAFWGDRTVSRYRLMRDLKHELCGDGLALEGYYKQLACDSASQETMQKVADEFLVELERVQIMFQVSPRLSHLAAEPVLAGQR